VTIQPGVTPVIEVHVNIMTLKAMHSAIGNFILSHTQIFGFIGFNLVVLN